MVAVVNQEDSSGEARGPFDLQPRQRLLAVITVLTAFGMEVLDSTIINIAIPAIQQDLAASTVAVQWMAAGYFLGFAVLLVTGGRLGDLFGYRRVFLIGIAGFTVASAACGFATTPGQLVVGRILQGATAAVMAPQVTAFIQLLYRPAERVSVLALLGVLGGVAAVLGPIIGGFLIEGDFAGLGWRLVFLINAPVGAAAFVAGWHLLPPGRSPHPLKLDPAGTLLLAVALTALLFPLIEARALGWPWWCLALVPCSVVLLMLFWRHVVRRHARTGSALLAPELFDDPRFVLGLACSLFMAIGGGGFLLVFTLTMQQGLGYGASDTALIHIPFAAGVMVGISQVGRKLLPRFGKLIVIGGAVAMAAGLASLAAAVAVNQLGWILASLLVAGLGMGMAIGPLAPITLAGVDRGHAGAAGGTHKTIQQVGGAMGTAIVGTAFFMLAQGGTGMPTAFAWAVALVTAALLSTLALATRLPDDIFADPPAH